MKIEAKAKEFEIHEANNPFIIFRGHNT